MTKANNKVACIPLYGQNTECGTPSCNGTETGETAVSPVADTCTVNYAGMEKEAVFCDLFTLACNRLAEIIPKCDDPVKLLKCIEQFSPSEGETEQTAPCDDAIEDTLRRIRRFEEAHGRYPEKETEVSAMFGETFASASFSRAEIKSSDNAG